MLASGGMMSQQIFQNQCPASFGGSYDGWPGMALKQIMGQIDLFQNFQNSSGYNGVGGVEKWQINMETSTNNVGFNNAQVPFNLLTN